MGSLPLYRGCDNVNPMQLVSIDGPTGIWAWTYVGASACTADLPQTALRADGVVAVATPGNTSGFPGLMILDGVTGTPLAEPPIPQSTYTSFNGQQTLGYSRVGPPMVDANGNVHLLFEKRQLAYPPQVVQTAIWLMKVRPDLTSTATLLSSSTNDTNLFPGRIIPDGTGGLLTTWIDTPVAPNGLPPMQSTLRAARIAASGAISLFDVPLTLPLDLLTSPPSSLPTNAELTLGESGRAFVTYGSTVVSFSVVDGSPIWNYSSGTQPIHALVADSSNGLVARVSTQTSDVLRFDQAGGVRTEAWAASTVNYFASGMWLGTTGSGDAAAFLAPPVSHATTGWFTATMGQSLQQLPNLYVSDPQNAIPVAPATNPQGVVRYAMQKVKLALEQELSTSFPTCNPWLNLNRFGVTGLSQLDLMLQANAMGHALFWGQSAVHGLAAQ